MKDSPLEMIARQYNNVVQYDAMGNPSIFAKFLKMKSSDLDPSLPAHTHPAFVIGGEEQDVILIGKFKNAELSENGTLYSLPNLPPKRGITYDEHLERMRAAGNGATGITIADHGLLMLLEHKNKWNQCGNSSFGSYAGVGAYPSWEYRGYTYRVGNKASFRGWLYECLIEHTSSSELHPGNSPLYWKRLKQVGGITIDDEDDEHYAPNNLYTLNGSGPLNWYMGGDITGPCDVVGNCREAVYGLRIVNCEIQILGSGNEAADADADCSPGGAWKAIKPSKSDNSYTLVMPGTAGTIHYTTDQNGNLTIDTVEPNFNDQYAGAQFNSIKVNTTSIPYVPSILYELGLAPIPGMTVHGDFELFMTRDEQVPYRAGYTPIYSTVGMASLQFMSRSGAYNNNGGRARSRLIP